MICFLDRDGIINYDYGYVGTKKRFKLIKEIIPILLLLKKNKYRFVIVTNQSGISRQFFTYKQFVELSLHLIELLDKYSIAVEINYCRHLPEDNCNCRKPKTGMFLNYKISNNDIMIGDNDSDMLAAKRVGIKRRYLINKKDIGPFSKRFNDHNELYLYLNYLFR